MKIGVDVGGTNTDAVVLGENGVLGWRKTPTTGGCLFRHRGAITHAIADAKVDRANVDCVMIAPRNSPTRLSSAGPCCLLASSGWRFLRHPPFHP